MTRIDISGATNGLRKIADQKVMEACLFGSVANSIIHVFQFTKNPISIVFLYSEISLKTLFATEPRLTLRVCYATQVRVKSFT